MARVLLVEDDPSQLELRKTILVNAGHEVEAATTLAEALERCGACEVVVMDLIAQSDELLQRLDPGLRIIVLSGWEPDRKALPRSVDAFLVKPCPTRQLLELIAQFCALVILSIVTAANLRAQTFQVHSGSEIIAELDLSAPGMDWAKEGHEAALVTVLVDGKPQQNIMLYAGADVHTYPLFLGPLTAGEHRLAIEGTNFRQHSARFREDSSEVLAHAPILYARPNTIGKFTDIPLIVYCERLREGGMVILQYTVIYSNEDAGTSTRALMARWGRTTDIEWVYRAFLNSDGTLHHAIIQAAAHKEIPFAGKLEGHHPVLITATDNNNVAYDAVSAVRYQIAPVIADLTVRSREDVMDEHPFAYVVMRKELVREHKLRPYGVTDGEKISDPRNYLYFELQVANQDAAVGVLVRLRSDPRWFAGYLGRSDYAITRDGWVRTTVELPPGTKAGDIGEIGFECLTPEKKLAGVCEVRAVSKCFFLDENDKPGPSIWTTNEPRRIPTGQIWTRDMR